MPMNYENEFEKFELKCSSYFEKMGDVDKVDFV